MILTLGSIEIELRLLQLMVLMEMCLGSLISRQGDTGVTTISWSRTIQLRFPVGLFRYNKQRSVVELNEVIQVGPRYLALEQISPEMTSRAMKS